MDVRQQDVERIVVEVLKKMMSDQPTAAATTVVAASGCDCGDFGLFDRLEDARAGRRSRSEEDQHRRHA